MGGGGREEEGEKGRRRGREGEEKRGKKGRDPQGLVDTLHVQNPEKYPERVQSLGKESECPVVYTQ